MADHPAPRPFEPPSLLHSDFPSRSRADLAPRREPFPWLNVLQRGLGRVPVPFVQIPFLWPMLLAPGESVLRPEPLMRSSIVGIEFDRPFELRHCGGEL